jgi:hypothetical protein
LYADLDPVRVLSDMRTTQQQLVDIADRSFVSTSVSTDALPIEEFLAGLRIAWKDGEVRPTALPKPKQKRGRRRLEPLAKVTEQLHTWFTAEHWRTARELLARLQAEYPGTYGDGLLRTLQRRLKIWRSEIAHTMVFGAMHSRQPENHRVRRTLKEEPAAVPAGGRTAGSTPSLPCKVGSAERMVGEHLMRQRSLSWGAFSNAAICFLTQIVAQHLALFHRDGRFTQLFRKLTKVDL